MTRVAKERGAATLAELPCACATARKMARGLTQLYDSRLRGAGIEAPQFILLMTLGKLGSGSETELGRHLGLDKTTVSRNLRLLERYGWIVSSIGLDRRKRQFELTPAGRERLALALPEWKKAQDQLRDALAPEDWAALFRISRLVANVAQGLNS